MKKEQLIELGLAADISEKIISLYETEIKEFIPKSRFDEVNKAKKQLEKDIIDRDSQLEDLKKSNGSLEDLKKQITTLQTENANAKTKYEADIRNIIIENAVNSALTNAKAKNAKAVKPFLAEFLEKAELDENGVIKGLDKELEKLTKDESMSFLFESESNSQGFRGISPVNGDRHIDSNGVGATMAQKYNSQFNLGESK